MDELEGAAARLVAEGQTAWPGVELEAGSILDHATRLALSAAQLAAVDRPGLYLACACARGDEAALQAFTKRYAERIPQWLRQISPDEAFLADVAQQVLAHLIVAPPGGEPRIAAYRGQGSLDGWVRVVATRQALSELRAHNAARPADDALLDEMVAPEDVELQALKSRYRPEVQEALCEALAALSGRAREVLELYYRQRMTVDALAAKFAIHRATAARRVASAREELVADARARVRRRLKIDDDELESILQALQSQLHLSLSGLAR